MTGDELSALEAIRKLKSRYFRFVDRKRFDDIPALFTRDAVFDLEGIVERDQHTGLVVTPGLRDHCRGTERAVIAGRMPIASFIKSMLADVISVHHGFTPEIDIISETEATGIWAMEDFFFEPHEPFRKIRHGHGHYHEGYHKEDGAWKIASIVLDFSHEERF